MNRLSWVLLPGLLCSMASAFAQNTASGSMTLGKHNVTIKHVYLVSAADGENKGRRLIFSASDIGASIAKCTNIRCATSELDEGLEIELDSGTRMNLWAVANGQKTQHSDTAVRSTLKASDDKPDAVAGVLTIDRSGAGGPKVSVDFKAKLTKAYKE